MEQFRGVLDFWFRADTRPLWFEPTATFDQTIRKAYAELFARAASGELEDWEAHPEGCLALCILLDQMPRHMFRGDRRAFATDDKALAVADHAVGRGFDQDLEPDQKQFLYMPFMHSEELGNQLRGYALFEAAGLREGTEYAQEHMAIIRRFGRFPHRNAILGRASTEDEVRFLEEQTDDFGQRSAAPSFRAYPGAGSPRADPVSAPVPADA